MDGDAQSYNNCIMVEFSVDRTADLWNPPRFWWLRRTQATSWIRARLRPCRTKSIQGWTNAHALWLHTGPIYGLRAFYQGSPQTFVLYPGNPTDDQHTFVRQLYINYYQREARSAGLGSVDKRDYFVRQQYRLRRQPAGSRGSLLLRFQRVHGLGCQSLP